MATLASLFWTEIASLRSQRRRKGNSQEEFSEEFLARRRRA